MGKRIVLTHAEIAALSDFASRGSRVRTFAIERNRANVLYVLNADSTTYRLTPLRDPLQERANEIAAADRADDHNKGRG